MEGIQISVEKTGQRNNISIIKVGGYIDTTTSSELEHVLSKLLKEGSYSIIIDLADVDYVSSAGWGIFISEIKGIREKGGDLKLVRMIPEVYEVFELLEFHYILKAFDSLEEAIKDFERNSQAVGPQFEVTTEREDEQSDEQEQHTGSSFAQKSADTFDSVDEKIKQIVEENPQAGITQISRTLNSPRFGNVKMGWFKIRKKLKQLGLDSKSKRSRHS